MLFWSQTSGSERSHVFAQTSYLCTLVLFVRFGRHLHCRPHSAVYKLKLRYSAVDCTLLLAQEMESQRASMIAKINLTLFCFFWCGSMLHIMYISCPFSKQGMLSTPLVTLSTTVVDVIELLFKFILYDIRQVVDACCFLRNDSGSEVRSHTHALTSVYQPSEVPLTSTHRALQP